MEQSGNKLYRDGVVEDLRDLRNKKKLAEKNEGNFLDPKDYHEAVKATSRYQVAKEDHLKFINQNFNTDNTQQEVPKNNDQESMEILLEKGIELIKTNPDFNFVVLAIGNVLGVARGDTSGCSAFVFDKQTQKMKEDRSGMLNSFDPPLSDKEKPKEVYVREKTINGKNYIMFRVPFRGKVGNPYCSDNRGGVHFTFGIEVVQGSKTLGPIGDKVVQEQDFTFALAKKCAELFTPDYFNFVKNS